MRPITTATLASVTPGNPVVLDYRAGNPQIGLNLLVTGVNTSSVQVTDDDVFAANYNPLTGNWFALPNAAAFTGATASQIGSVDVASFTAIRLNMAAWTSGGATLKVIQNSIAGA